VKKFGGQKAISSDQYFGRNGSNDVSMVHTCRMARSHEQFETRSTLSRFEGSTGISSADYYAGAPGAGGSTQQRSYTGGVSSQMPDVQVSVCATAF
jgi:hypothetical protein